MLPQQKEMPNLKGKNLKGRRLTPRRKMLVWERDNFKCYYCGLDLKEWKKQRNSKSLLTIDHKEPISKGGTNEMNNLVTACSYCNSKKGDKKVRTYNGGTITKDNILV